jgi:hypothetical protein
MSRLDRDKVHPFGACVAACDTCIRVSQAVPSRTAIFSRLASTTYFVPITAGLALVLDFFARDPHCVHGLSEE